MLKNLEEMRRLARMARNIGQPDLALEKAIAREEQLTQKILKPEVIHEEKVFVQELVDDPRSSSGQSLVQKAVEVIHAPTEQPPVLQEKLRDAEIAGIRRQISDLIAKMGTLSWGGGGTGVVNFKDLDDHQHPQDIRILEFNTAGAAYPPPAGSLTWNPEEECLNVHQPDGTTLQAGLESYIRVHNHTGGTLPAGMFVMFAGVNEPEPGHEDHAPTVVPYLANAEYPPLYTVGVLTENIANSETGRATTFGKVRELDTTGTAVGETWQLGDLLWAHPTIPGALTRVQPTAPNLAVSVAAVLHVDATNGVLLVRPTIFPRLHYGTFSSNTEQTAAQTNTPYAVTFDTTGIGCGHIQINPNNTANVNVVHQGLYSFDFRLQVISTNSSRAFIWIWARVNGVDVPRSASKLSIESNGGEATPSWAFRLPMEANSVFQLMWAVDSTNVKLSAPTNTAFAPATPAALLQVTQVNL